jgi:DNA topoisomerase-1
VLKLPASWSRLGAETRRVRRAAARTRAAVHSGKVPDPLESARLAGLRHVNDETAPGIRRLGSTRFKYVDPSGRVIRDPGVLARIRALAIPPAWTGVWISPTANAHIQATGRDARGRKQYRYHADWRRIRDEVKYGRLIAFSEALPKIREQTDADLRRQGLPREKVLAAVVQLLEKTLIRVGNEEYARQNGSIGLTTMKDGHAKIAAGQVRFEFRGKSGIQHAIALNDRRLARIIKACRDLPGYELFQYLDRQGRRQVIDSADVNAYLREISGHDYSAKDFRTWAGTVMAAQALAAVEAFSSPAQAKRNVIAAIESVAKRLGNTRSVCRKCYIHPAILDGYMDGATIATLRGRAARVAKSDGLSAEEAAVVAMIELGLAAQSKPRGAGRSVAISRQPGQTARAKGKGRERDASPSSRRDRRAASRA